MDENIILLTTKYNNIDRNTVNNCPQIKITNNKP